MSKLHREIISRLAMLVLGGGLLFCGIGCFRAVSMISNDPVLQDAARSSGHSEGGGLGLPFIAGCIFCFFGAPITLAAVVPTAVFEKMMGPPRIPSLYDRPEPSQTMKYWW